MSNPKGKIVMVGGMDEKELPAKENDRYYVFVDKGNCVHFRCKPEKFVGYEEAWEHCPDMTYALAVGTLEQIKAYQGQKPYKRAEHKERMRSGKKLP